MLKISHFGSTHLLNVQIMLKYMTKFIHYIIFNSYTAHLPFFNLIIIKIY